MGHGSGWHQVPISLAYRKGLQRDGANPAFLYGYGAYGANVEPRFQSQRISLLDRGFVVALAHVRGGSEMGRAWYENGQGAAQAQHASRILSPAPRH